VTQFDVFLSHNGIDKPWARQLKIDLRAGDFGFWSVKEGRDGGSGTG
jgi:hypothetical protein